MNNIQNNKILAVRRPSPLVRVWHSIGDPGMPLVGIWVQADTAKLGSSPADPSRDEMGDYAYALDGTRGYRDHSHSGSRGSECLAAAHFDLPDGLWPRPDRHGGGQ